MDALQIVVIALIVIAVPIIYWFLKKGNVEQVSEKENKLKKLEEQNVKDKQERDEKKRKLKDALIRDYNNE